MSIDDYPLLVCKLSDEDGGGYFATPIDLPSCGVDGDTPEAAVTECRAALRMILDVCARRDKPVPPPTTNLTGIVTRQGLLQALSRKPV